MPEDHPTVTTVAPAYVEERLAAAQEELRVLELKNTEETMAFEAIQAKAHLEQARADADADIARKQIAEIAKIPGLSKADYDQLERWTKENVVNPAEKKLAELKAANQKALEEQGEKINKTREQIRSTQAAIAVFTRLKG